MRLALFALALALRAAPTPTPQTHGLNHWSCKPAGLEPVVLLHGLNAPSWLNWAIIGPALAAERSVYWVDFGQGLGPGYASMWDSVTEVGAFVDKVKASTGAGKVDIVAHSAATLVATMYLKKGGAASVRRYVGFGSLVRGTTLHGLGTLLKGIPGLPGFIAMFCPACVQLIPPSDFLAAHAEGGISVPGTEYVSIATKYDEVVAYETGLIREPGTTDIVIQDLCALDFAGHNLLAADPNVLRLIRWALGGRVGEPIPRGKCVPFLLPIKREEAETRST